MRHPHARHREERRRKREARLFYGLRRQRRHGADVLPQGEAKAMSPWRGCAVALLAIAAVAALLGVAAKFFV